MAGVVTGWFLKLDDKPEDEALWRVLVVMADAADMTGGNIRLAAETIAFRAGPRFSRATVRRRLELALAELWRPWALEVAAPGDRRRATVYRFANYRNLSATPATVLADNSELLATNGQYVGQTRTQPGHQMATPRTTLATNVFTVTTGLGADPDPDPQTVRADANSNPATAAASDPAGSGRYFAPGTGWVEDWPASADETSDSQTAAEKEAARRALAEWRNGRAARDRAALDPQLAGDPPQLAGDPAAGPPPEKPKRRKAKNRETSC
jgi:hypothetical protein